MGKPKPKKVRFEHPTSFLYVAENATTDDGVSLLKTLGYTRNSEMTRQANHGIYTKEERFSRVGVHNQLHTLFACVVQTSPEAEVTVLCGFTDPSLLLEGRYSYISNSVK